MVEIVGLQALAEFLFTPVMLNSLANNLKKPIQPLYPTQQTRQNKQFSEALQAVLDVLDENPSFLTYRMGVEQGHLAESAVRLLRSCWTLPIIRIRPSYWMQPCTPGIEMGGLKRKPTNIELLPDLKQIQTL